MSQSRSNLIPIIPVLLVLWFMMTYQIAEPYYIGRDAPQIWVPAAVRNFDVYGTEEIGLMIVKNASEEDDISKLTFYSHHPPLIVWLPALITKFVGHNELAIRFIFPAAMMIATAAFYVLVRRLYDDKIAFWSIILFAISPLNSISQAGLAHDPLGFAAALLYAAIFVNWLRQPNRTRFIGLILTTILSVWTAWPALFFVGIIGILGILFGDWKHRIGIVILGIISVISIVIMLLLYESWWSGSIFDLINVFFWRASAASTSQNSASFTVIDWLAALIHHMVFYATVAVVVLSFIGIQYLRNKGSRFANSFTFALLIAGVFYLLVFRNAGYVHVYYKAFLLPACAISGAFAIVYARQAKTRFVKPLIDGLLISFVFQTIFIFNLAYSVPHRENLENIVRYITERQDLPEEIYILYPAALYGSDNALEYYTNHGIEWNSLLQDLPDEHEEILFIYCNDEQSYMQSNFDELPPHTQLDEQCTAYELGSD